MFTTIGKRQSLSKDVEKQIEKAILSRTIVSGDRLPSENELAEQFGVSRTAIREALRMLDARGLVRIVKGKGIFVRDMTPSMVTDPLHLYLQVASETNHVFHLIHARQIIEPAIAAAAAKNRTKLHIEKLRMNLKTLVGCGNDKTLMTSLDMAFHIDIAEASGSPILPLLLEPIHRLFPPIKHAVYEHIPDAKESAVIWHTKIFEAIEARDSAAAQKAMTKHLKIAEEHIQRSNVS